MLLIPDISGNGKGVGYQSKASRSTGIYSAYATGTKGDGVTDDYDAIVSAMLQVSHNGGGTVILPSRKHRIRAPLQMISNVNVVGAFPDTTLIKDNGATFAGIDCVVYGYLAVNFTLENVSVRGNRHTAINRIAGSALGNVTTDGFYFDLCEQFTVLNCKATYCKRGYNFRRTYIGELVRCVAFLCQNQGFLIHDSCTSTTQISCGSYACGGGWDISAALYVTLINPWVELSDFGGRPFGASAAGDDPFGDSGGNYANPSYMYSLSGSHGVNILAPGSEQSYSQFLYAEGSEGSIFNPFFYNLRANYNQWRFIQLRGNANCNMTIHGMSGHDTLVPTLIASGIYIEDQTKQQLDINGKYRINTIDALPNMYPARGMNHSAAVDLIDINQSNMLVGGVTAFQKAHVDDDATIVFAGELKRTKLRADGVGSTKRFFIPLPVNIQKGMFQVSADIIGTALTDFMKVHLVEVNAAGAFIQTLKTFTAAPGTTSSINEHAYVAVTNAAYRLRLDVVMGDAAETYDFTRLQLKHTPGQD